MFNTNEKWGKKLSESAYCEVLNKISVLPSILPLQFRFQEQTANAFG